MITPYISALKDGVLRRFLIKEKIDNRKISYKFITTGW